jgi:sugar phosphate isomerase/epimerase
MGYEGVEFAGYYNRTAAELRKILDDLGLKVAGSHIGLDTLLGDELEKTIEFNKTLGNKFLIVPWIPEERRNSKAAWLEMAQLFSEIAEKVKRRGMRVGYHNHHMEFTPIDGEMPWDIFYGAASPEVVMQLDIGNALYGKISVDDVLAVVKRCT